MTDTTKVYLVRYSAIIDGTKVKAFLSSHYTLELALNSASEALKSGRITLEWHILIIERNTSRKERETSVLDKIGLNSFTWDENWHPVKFPE